MKILLKLYSELFGKEQFPGDPNNPKGKEIPGMLQQLLTYAEGQGIIIWLAAENISFPNGVNSVIDFKSLTISSGSYNGSIPLNKTFDYFNFQYPGDKVKDNVLKSSVTSTKNIFKFITADFETGIEQELIDQFVAQGGVQADSTNQKILLHVENGEKPIIKSINRDKGEPPIFIITAAVLQQLLPHRTTKEINPILQSYSKETIANSLASDRRMLSNLKKLLSSTDKSKVDAGLNLLATLNDPCLSDILLQDISVNTISGNNITVLVPDGIFKTTLIAQPIHNHAICGILFYAPPEAIHATSLKKNVRRLAIDILAVTWLHCFSALEYLELTDSSGLLTTLSDLDPSLKLNTLYLKNCSALEDIDRVSEFPISGFDPGDSRLIKSFAALQSKKDKNGIKQLNLEKFRKLSSLEGIEFFQDLESIFLNDCDSLKDASALLKCPEFKRVADESLVTLKECVSLEGLIGPENKSVRYELKSWQEPTGQPFKSVNYLELRCPGMTNLDWLPTFPNITILEIESEALSSISGLRFTKNLRHLILSNSGLKDLTGLSELKNLISIDLYNCNKIEDLDPLEHISTLESLEIQNCTSLKSISGATGERHKSVRINNRHIVDEWMFENLPALTKVGDLSKHSQLKSVTFNDAINSAVLQDLATATNLNKISIYEINGLKLNSDAVINSCMRLTGLRPEELNLQGLTAMEIIDTELPNLTCFQKFNKLKKLTLENCSGFTSLDGICEMPELESLSIINCEDFRILNQQDKLKSLKKIRLEELPELREIHLDRNDGPAGIKKIELINCGLIENFNFISGIKELESLMIHKTPTLTSLSGIAGLTMLKELDIDVCPKLEVPPRPKHQTSRDEVLKYQLKLAGHYKLEIENELSKAVKVLNENSKPKTRNSSLSKIKKLILERDLEKILAGISLLESLNDPELFDLLLDGVSLTETKLIPNKIFTGSGQAQPWLNTALTGTLAAAAAAGTKWKNICNEIRSLEIESYHLDYFKCFSQLENLKIRDLKYFSEELNLPLLQQFELITDYFAPVANQEFHLNKISGFPNIKEIKISWKGNLNADLSALKNFTFLEKLHLDIYDFNLVNLENLRFCNGLREFKIYSRNGQIDSLEGLDFCQNLEVLDFRSTRVINTAALQKLKNLREIRLRESTDTHLELPADATKLKTLLLSDCKNLQSINSGNFAPTIDLTISSSGLTELPNLNGLSELSNLGLYENKKLLNLNSLNKIKNIHQKEISLSGCNALQDINGIFQIRNLMLQLSISRLPENIIQNDVIRLELTDITTLAGIEKFTELKELELICQKEENLTGELLPLKGISKLEILNIRNHKGITSLKGIGHFTSLKTLNLEYTTSLVDISELETMDVELIYILGSNKKKRDFPSHLQDKIIWR